MASTSSVSTARLTILFVLALVTLFGARVQAANRTWNGGSTNNNWSTAGNWGGTAPVASDLLFFDGTNRLTNTNNIAANTAFNGITFNSPASAFTLRGNALNLAGGVTNNCSTNAETIGLNLALTATRTFDVVSGGTLSVGGTISGSGFGVTKVDAGTLTLSGTNTYTGGTTINGGTVSITKDSNLGGSGGLIFANGGTLLNTGTGAQSSSRAITLNSGGGLITMSGPTMTLTGSITGGGGLTTGGSDLVLQPASGNNAIGTMTVNSGRLFVFNTGAINGSAVVVQDGATIDFGSSASASPANTMTFASGACLANRLSSTLTVSTTTATFPSAGTMIFNQDDATTTAITVSGAYPTLTGNLTIQVGGSTGAPGTVTLSGAISGSHGLLKTSNGTLILSGANSYTGDTTINAGTLRLGAANIIPDGSGKGNVTVNGTLDLGGFSDTLNGLNGSGTVDNTVGTGAYTLTVGNNDQTSTFSGTLSDTLGAVSLTKIGAGTLTLSGTNTFSGVATVLGGALAIQKDGGLGSVTSVNVGTGTMLTLGSGASNNYINDSAAVALTNTAVMNLAFTGSDTVANLYISGVHKLAGTWGATGSGATYVDNTHFQGTGVLNVTSGPTSTTTVAGSPNPSTWGQSVTFTATVTGNNGTPPLTGTVTFRDGATVLGTGTLSGSPAATATFSTNGFATGAHTITAIYSGDGNFAGSTSGNYTQTVNPGPLAKLQLLLPGETAAPGTTTGKTGTPNAQTAGAAYAITVNAVDANWNVVSTNDTVAITCTDTNATLPANAALTAGSKTFSVTNKTAGSWTVKASDTTHTGVTANTSPSFTVNPGAFAKLQLLMPGETAAPGTSTGKTGTPSAQNTDNPLTVTVRAVDANWNLVNTVNDTAAISSSDAYATLPPNAALSGGAGTFNVKFNTAGSRTVTATDVTDGTKTANTSPSITVNLGAFARLQVLMPGETAAPGATSGKTGSPTAQTAGTSFSVTVRSVDASWNLISTNDTVHLTSSDAQATLPANAALSSGSATLSLTNKTSGTQTVTASDVTHAGIGSNTGTATTVNPAAASKLVLATQPSATAVAGTTLAQQPVIWIEDVYNNVRSNDTLTVTATRSAGAGTLLGTTNVTAVAGVATFTNLAHPLATNITIQFTSGALTAATSTTITVSAGPLVSQLLVLLPGETAAPGTTTGRSGTPTAQTAGTAFTVRVSAVDAYWNLLNTVTDLVGITSSDTTATLPASAALVNGTNSFSVTLNIAGSQTVTASDASDGHTAGSSSVVTVNKGSFVKLQLLVPGETAVPGTTTGKTGTPTAQVAGTAFNVTVNAVDAKWNLISTNDTIKITSSDTSATLPANAALIAGTKTFSVTLNTGGSSTITASNVTHTAIAASTSPAISVGNVLPVTQSRPVVAIHDSELTRALETLPATGSTPSGAGTTGYQWWPTNWHYFVMPDSVKETLRSDGTAYEVLGDVDISSGRLLAANGQPRCPIVISLASEAIRDDEIAQLTNYVAAGGTLLVGSSAFTRNTNGTSRGDFALAAQMGVHMINSSLVNWAPNNTFTKSVDHRLISHIPGGALTWRLPSAAEEIPWGISPDHPFLAAHSTWQVQASDATILAQGDSSPYLLTKSFGKGRFIYLAPMQPLMGFNSFAPTMYSYVIFRKAIEWAFESAKLPVPKVSPWPYAYDAAFVLRRDLENFTNAIATVAASAQIDYTNGASGDYYFCTGTLREDAAPAYNTNTIIAGLRQAVTNYGASIYPHNGGLKNPNNPLLVRGQYDYWHWGPDEALDATPTNFPSGKAYALASISNSFHDVELWLSGLTNGLRGWCGCYFNATREDSYDIQAQLRINMAGDQKLSPFPHWTLSTRTADKRYAFLSEPVSDWFVGGVVAQSLEPWHPPGVQTSQTLHEAVDFYYNLGALLNFYSHTLSTGLGDAGSLPLDYITYSLNTNRHPRLWSANAAKVYQWWLARSNAQIIPSFSANGNQAITTLSIKGAADARTAVEVFIPQPSFYGLQIFTNGSAASGSSYRTNGQVVKLLVGTSVTNAEIRYTVAPAAVNDIYNVTQGSTLTVPAPGILSNDVAGLSGSLTAILVSGPAHGTLALSTNGGFTYTPATGFNGLDSFSYRANDGVTNSGTALVTLQVTPAGEPFADDFTRSGTGDPLGSWQVALGTWTVTNGVFQGTGAQQSYCFSFVADSWTNYSVQGRVQFPAGAFGGGLGGRLDSVTGAHYAAWIYPEGSPGGSSMLKLIKFQNWAAFGYNGSSYTPIQEVSLSGVGTNWHTVKLAFLGSRIAVYFDGSQVMSVTDVESQPYPSGGISVDMWRDTTPYTMSVDDIVVMPLALVDNYSVTENTTLTVPAPGVLGNDTEVYGTTLAAVIVNGPTNGSLSFHSDGSFSYSPATNFAGADSFAYQANDGQDNLGATLVNITVNPALIVTADNQSRTYGTGNPALTGSIVGLQNGDDITATFSTVADTNSPVGGYPIVINFSDPGHKLTNYLVTTNSGTLTVNPAALTVWADSQSKVYGTANPTFTGALVGVRNSDSITATYATTATAGSPVGTYAITPTLVDPNSKLGNYTVNSTNGVLTVNRAALTVTADPQTRTYGASNPSLTATISGFVNGDTLAAAVTGVPAISTTATVSSTVGPYPIVSAVGSLSAANYSFNFVNGTLTVTPATLTGTAEAKSRLYGAANPPFTVSYSGFVNGQDSSVVTGALSSSTAATTNSPVGSYSISVWGQSAPNYTMQYVAGTLTVEAAPLLVTGDNASRAYGQANPAFSATITGWVNGESTNVLGGALVLSSPAQTNSPVGTYPIIPSGLTSTNYALTFSNGTLTVTAYALNVTAHSHTRSYGATNPEFGGTVPGLQNGDDITATYATTATQTSPVGTYAITPALVDPNGKLGNYTVHSTNGTLTVEAAPLLVTGDNASRAYGQANPAFSATITGWVNGEDTNVLGGALTLTSPAQTNSPVGTYPIIPSGLTSTNYALTFSNGTLTVTAYALSVTADSHSRSYGATNPVLGGTITGLQNGDDITATYAAIATQTSPVGTYAITPTLVDPSGKLGNYTVHSTNGTLTVEAAPLLVTGDNTSRAYGQANPAFSATITGWVNGEDTNVLGGALALTSPAQTNSPVGTYPIIPSGLTSTNYALTFSNGTLTVTAYALSVTADSHSRSYGATNPVFGGTITGLQNGDNITATYATTATETSPVGTYAITPALVDPNGKLGNYTVHSTDGTLTVNPATLTGIAEAKSRLYGAANPPFTVSYSGFVNGQDSSVVTGVLSSSTAATTNSPAGSYSISVWGQSAPNYTMQYVAGTLTVEAAPLLVTGDNNSRAYGQANPAFSATITGWVNGEDTNVLGGALALISPAQTNSPVGTYPIIPSGLTSTNYALSFSNGTLTVTAYALSVTADSHTRSYGATNPVFEGTIIGLMNGDNITANYATTATETSPVGTYAIIPTLVDPTGKLGNYTVSSTNGTLTVEAAPLLVTGDNASRAYGQANPAFSATITGWVNGEDTNVLGGALALTSPAETNSPVGTYPIIPAGLISTNYALTFSNGTLTVTAYALSVTADSHTRSYGATNPVFGGTITGLVNGDNITANYATTATETSPVGTYAIIPTLVDPSGKLGNYTVSSTNGTLTVEAAPLLVTGDNTSRAYGQANPAFSATITGWVNGEDTNVLGGALALTSPAETNSPVGTYPIIPAGLISTNYALTFSNGTLAVTAYALSVTADSLSRSYGATNPVFEGTIIGLVNGDNITATYATTATETSPVGTFAIIPTLVDPSGKLGNYTVSSTNGTLTVEAAPLLVTGDNTSRAYGQANPAFSATITGWVNGEDTNVLGGALALSSPTQTNSPVGTYPIIPAGLTSTNYALTFSNGTLTVTAYALSVTADSHSRSYGATNPVFGGMISGLQNGDDITANYATTATETSPAGAYAITPTLVDPSGKLGNYNVTLTDGILTITASATPPVLAIMSAGNTDITITWTSVSNSVYRVQYKADLASTNWLDLIPDVTATGNTASFTDQPAPANQRYYRVTLRP